MAARAVSRGADVQFAREPTTALQIGREPHGVHQLERPEVRLRMAMAVDAPAHCHVLDLGDRCHSVHMSMAGLTAHTVVDVCGMIEKHEIR